MKNVELSQQDLGLLVNSLAKLVSLGQITIGDCRVIVSLFDKLYPLIDEVEEEKTELTKSN